MTLNIEFEQDWSAGLGSTLEDGYKIKKYFSSFIGLFGKRRGSAMLLGFECTINPQNFMEIVGAIFEKTEI